MNQRGEQEAFGDLRRHRFRQGTNGQSKKGKAKKEGRKKKRSSQNPDLNKKINTHSFKSVRIYFSVGGDIPSKSEPNSALISSIVAVFEPSL